MPLAQDIVLINPTLGSLAVPAQVSEMQGTVLLTPNLTGVRVHQQSAQVAVRPDQQSDARFSEVQATVLLDPADQAIVHQLSGSVAVRPDQQADARFSEVQATALMTAGDIRTVQAISGSAAIRPDQQSDARFSEVQATTLFSPLTAGLTPPIVKPDVADNPMFLANWADRVEIEETWPTKMARSTSRGNVEAVSLADRPKRKVRFSWLFGSEDDNLRQKRSDLFSFLEKMTSQRTFVPLYPDAVHIDSVQGDVVATIPLSWASSCKDMSVTEYLMSDGGTLACGESAVEDAYDLSCRRYHRFKPVAIFATDYKSELIPQSVQYFTVDTVADNAITFSDGSFPELPTSDPFRAWNIVPMMQVELVSEPTIRALGPEVFAVELEAFEVFGPTALPAFRAPYQSTPTLDQTKTFPDHLQGVGYEMRRRVSSNEQGRGRFIEALDDRQRLVMSWSSVMSREEWCGAGGLHDIWEGVKGPWETFITSEQLDLGFCRGGEASTGQLYFDPLRIDDVIQKTADANALAAETGDPVDYTAAIEAAQYGFDAWKARIEQAGKVCIVSYDGSETYKNVTYVSNLNNSWVIGTVEGFAADVAGSLIEKVYPAREFRFDSSTIVQQWIGPCIVRSSVRIIEAPNDQEVEI
jgi:hypothetical protein